jgi:hypothetical protein
MASAGTISHNPNLSTQVTGWMKLAENVGMGPSIDSVHQAFVASHPHYVNLTDTQVTAVGIGVVTSGATVFIVEDFLGRSGATVAPPATVASPTTPAPPSRAPVAPRVTATTAPVPPLTPGPPVPPRTPASAVAPAAATAPVAGAAPPAPPPEPSPWLALALEVTRGWERTSG